MAYRTYVDTCDRCRGSGLEVTSEWNDQYDRTHQSLDTCGDCGGEGTIIIEEEDDA